jgi:ribosomal protein S12 methylthiotransferase
MVTLGCTSNEVDSEELAKRLEAGSFRLAEDPENADTRSWSTPAASSRRRRRLVDTLLEAPDQSFRALEQPVVVPQVARQYRDPRVQNGASPAGNARQPIAD